VSLKLNDDHLMMKKKKKVMV